MNTNIQGLIPFYRMTRVVTLFFATILGSAAGIYTVPTTGVAATLTYNIVNNEVIIVECSPEASGELIIPSVIEGKNVTSIGDLAFLSIGLTSVTIPDSVTSIGGKAFENCISLTSVTIGASVTSIGDLAFEDCHSLTNVTIGTSVTSIGNEAFKECTTLTNVTIPDSVTSIGSEVFRNCLSLTSVSIGTSVTSIGSEAFEGCKSLTSVTIPGSVTSIGRQAFKDCAGLTSVTIPDSVTSIEDEAFEDCTSLISVIFEGVAPTVGSSVFDGITKEAKAIVQPVYEDSFGGAGFLWSGLIVELALHITRSGSVNGGTFFIEFEPAGLGYRVMSSPTLDFNNAVEVTPTYEPTTATDNRFEFQLSGSRNFYRLEKASQ